MPVPVTYSVRHYCNTCGQRVFPYDSLENATEAPELGASGKPVLLYSFNNHRRARNPRDPSRIAWCWVCETWVQTTRQTRFDDILRYVRRAGGTLHFNARTEQAAARLVEDRLEARREGSGIIELPKRKLG